MREEILTIFNDSTGEEEKYRGVYLISGAAGSAMPHEFAEDYPSDTDNWSDVDSPGWHYNSPPYFRGILLSGPEKDEGDYLETWVAILDNTYYVDEADARWTLYIDEGGCNLWRITKLGEE